MRLRISALALIVGLSLGCHAHVTIVTPQGRTAYTADQIGVRVNELENAAITANGSNVLPLATTRTIVEFAVAADKTLAATPTGWSATLAVAWNQAKAKIGVVTNPAVSAAMSAVDIVLAVTP